MTNFKPFFSESAETASFAFRAYFRPLTLMFRSYKPFLTCSDSTESTKRELFSLEDVRQILRERLANGRRHEKILLLQSVITALASVISVAILIMYSFHLQLVAVLAILLAGSAIAIWLTISHIRKREDIVEVKTLRWIMNSVDEQTGVQIAKHIANQVPWGKSKRLRRKKNTQA